MVKTSTGGMEFIYTPNKTIPLSKEELQFEYDNMNKTDKSSETIYKMKKEVYYMNIKS